MDGNLGAVAGPAGQPLVDLATGRPMPVLPVGAASWRFAARAGHRYRAGAGGAGGNEQVNPETRT